MNIIDTRSNITFSNDKKGIVRNISLFDLKGVDYTLPKENFTDIVFQSVPSIQFFQEKELLINKNIYTMGPSTKRFLLRNGFDSICPSTPGSRQLNKLITNSENNKFLIVKGKDGLSEVFNYLNKSCYFVKEVSCYERVKFDDYDDVKKSFLKADAIIFSSTYGVKIFFEEIYSPQVKASLFGISKRIISYIANFGCEAKFIDYFSNNIKESIQKSI